MQKRERGGNFRYNLRPQLQLSSTSGTNSKIGIRKKKKSNGRPKWTDLPRDHLNLISTKLTIGDFLSIGHVCTEWRKSFQETKHRFLESQPPLLSHIISRVREPSCHFYDIFSQNKYQTKLPYPCNNWLGSSSGFLIFVDNHRNIWLLHPVTGQQIKFPNVPQPINQWYRYDQAIVASVESRPGHVLIVVLSRARWNSNLCYCISGDNKWRRYSSRRNPWIILDIVIFQGKIFALTSDFQIGVFDLRTCDLKFLKLNDTPKLHVNYSRFGVSKDRLLVVDYAYLPRTNVYWIDFSEKEWIEMDDLGDESLFITYKMSSRLCDATQWGGRGNFVYHLPFISKSYLELSLNGEIVTGIPICPENASPRMNFWYFLHQYEGTDMVSEGF